MLLARLIATTGRLAGITHWHGSKCESVVVVLALMANGTNDDGVAVDNFK